MKKKMKKLKKNFKKILIGLRQFASVCVSLRQFASVCVSLRVLGTPDLSSEYGLFSHAYNDKKFLRKDYILCHQNAYVKR